MDKLYLAAYSSPVKRKVLGDINNVESPISPTANLKLLTKVASQFDSIENKFCVETPPNAKLVEHRSVNLNSSLQGKGVRKFKSLGFLCDNFLKMYPLDVPDDGSFQILLTDLASHLGVEKRRIYDIINVVESLQMATKVGKNSYTWSGHKNLSDILSQLKAWAEQVGLVQYVRSEQIKRKLYLKLHDSEREIYTTDQSTFTENPNIASFFRNERRIGILCQKFVMLFLVSLKDGLINLDLAAQVLVANGCQQNKTRLRRLYDIANILVSLGVIRKHETTGFWKKPVFQYAGPQLHNLDGLSSESFFSNLVKTEPSEGFISDLSEDSCESTAKIDPSLSLAACQADHSYCLSAGSDKAVSVEPAAKKRLVFCSENVRMLRPQPIASGGLYKAVQVGNNIQLIRIDQH